MLFHIEDDSLTIKFQGMEIIWVTKFKLTIPKTDIVTLEWQETATLTRRDVGISLGPWPSYTGRVFGKGTYTFTFLHLPNGANTSLRPLLASNGGIDFKHVLSMDLRNQRYTRLLLTVDDPDIAEQLIAWWRSNS